jgi:hypothetical protein
MSAIIGMLLLMAYPGDQPPAGVFAAICTGTETIIAAKGMETHPWRQKVTLDLPKRRFCLDDCATWRPIAAIEDSGARLVDILLPGKAGMEQGFFGWKAGRLHYLWADQRIVDGHLRSTDHQGNCTLEPPRN